MKKVKKSLITSIVCAISLLGMVANVEATGVNGGAVQTNGVIRFYEESTEPSSSESSSTEPSTTEPSSVPSSEPSAPSEAPAESSSSEEPVKKPGGSKYPSTGELVKASFTIVGAVLAGAAIFFFLIRRRNASKGGHS